MLISRWLWIPHSAFCNWFLIQFHCACRTFFCILFEYFSICWCLFIEYMVCWECLSWFCQLDTTRNTTYGFRLSVLPTSEESQPQTLTTVDSATPCLSWWTTLKPLAKINHYPRPLSHTDRGSLVAFRVCALVYVCHFAFLFVVSFVLNSFLYWLALNECVNNLKIFNDLTRVYIVYYSVSEPLNISILPVFVMHINLNVYGYNNSYNLSVIKEIKCWDYRHAPPRPAWSVFLNACISDIRIDSIDVTPCYIRWDSNFLTFSFYIPLYFPPLLNSAPIFLGSLRFRCSYCNSVHFVFKVV